MEKGEVVKRITKCRADLAGRTEIYKCSGCGISECINDSLQCDSGQARITRYSYSIPSVDEISVIDKNGGN